MCNWVDFCCWKLVELDRMLWSIQSVLSLCHLQVTCMFHMATRSLSGWQQNASSSLSSETRIRMERWTKRRLWTGFFLQIMIMLKLKPNTSCTNPTPTRCAVASMPPGLNHPFSLLTCFYLPLLSVPSGWKTLQKGNPGQIWRVCWQSGDRFWRCFTTTRRVLGRRHGNIWNCNLFCTPAEERCMFYIWSFKAFRSLRWCFTCSF